MRTTKLKSDYNPETGFSIVAIQKGSRTYLGMTKLHDEDRDVASSYAGCTFAEIKARIAMAKDDYKTEGAKLETLENLYGQMTQLRNWENEKHSRMARYTRKMIKMQTKKVEELRAIYLNLKKGYPEMVDNRLNGARTLPKVKERTEAIRAQARTLAGLDD